MIFINGSLLTQAIQSGKKRFVEVLLNDPRIDVNYKLIFINWNLNEILKNLLFSNSILNSILLMKFQIFYFFYDGKVLWFILFNGVHILLLNNVLTLIF